MLHEQSLAEFQQAETDDQQRCAALMREHAACYFLQKTVRELSERAMHRPAPKKLRLQPYDPAPRLVPSKKRADAAWDAMQATAQSESTQRWPVRQVTQDFATR